VLPETDLNAALERAEQIRKKVESDLQFFLEDGRHFSVTTSFGVAVMESSDSVDTLMKRADLCLYEAKQNGRNQVRPALLRRPQHRCFRCMRLRSMAGRTAVAARIADKACGALA
jgi:predicted signal transduction protein with EAL and GGDEF domain